MALQEVVWPTSLITKMLPGARRITWVAKGTPADKMGLKVGQLLLSVAAESPDSDLVLAAQLTPMPESIFYDEATGATHSLQEARLPLGFGTGPALNKAYGLELRKGTHYGIDVFDPWIAGEVERYAPFVQDFEAALLPRKAALLGGFMKADKREAAMLDSTDRWSQLGLGLAHLAAGDFDKAWTFAIAYEDTLSRDPKGSDMTHLTALKFYIAARCVLEQGDADKARDWVQRSLDFTPRAVPSQRLYRKLMGKGFEGPPMPGAGDVFPDMYELFQYDPYDIVPRTEEPLRLADHVARLEPGEYGLVCLLGRYRSNGPFLDDLYTLGALQTGMSGGPVFCHIVHSFKDDPELGFQQDRRAQEEFFREKGVRFDVCYDPDHAIGETMDVRLSPMWFVIRAGGHVSSAGWLRDAEILEDIFREGA